MGEPHAASFVVLHLTMLCCLTGRQQAAVRRSSDLHAPYRRRAAWKPAVTVRATSACCLCCLQSDTHVSRRERKQLTRTTADMFRLVPLLVIVVRAWVALVRFRSLTPSQIRLFPSWSLRCPCC